MNDLETGQLCSRCHAWRGELGAEPHPDLFVDHLVLVFDAVRRVLRDDGLLWVVIGDSHWTAKGSCFNPGGGEMSQIPEYRKAAGILQVHRRNRSDCDYLKPGDKCGVPERFALAMQARDWYWRQTVIWNKPSCLPESVDGTRWERCRVKVRRGEYGQQVRARSGANRDGCLSGAQGLAEWTDCPGCDKCCDGYVLRYGSWRTTNSFEYVFQFAKSPRYWSNAEVAKEPHGYNRWSDRRLVDASVLQAVYDDEAGDSSVLRSGTINCFPEGGRNPRSVWTINSETFHGPHYAAFPSALAAKCMRPSVPERCCSKCGTGYAPVIGDSVRANGRGSGNKERFIASEEEERGRLNTHMGSSIPWEPTASRIIDYWPTCTCCQTCDTMGLRPEQRRLVHVQEHRSQEGIRSDVLQEEIPGESGISGLGRSEKTEISKTVRHVPCQVQGSKQDSEILLSDMFTEVDVENGTRKPDDSRCQEQIPERDQKRNGNQGTSSNYGASFGKEAPSSRACPSHQRRQERQSTGKSGCADAAGSRQEAHESSIHVIVPYKQVPGTVLDPFLGTGTTLMVSKLLGLRGVGIELNPEYVEMAVRRIRDPDAAERPADAEGQLSFRF